MLRPAESDPFRTEGTGAFGVGRVIRVRPDFEVGDFVRPGQELAQVFHFGNIRNDDWNAAVIDLPG